MKNCNGGDETEAEWSDLLSVVFYFLCSVHDSQAEVVDDGQKPLGHIRIYLSNYLSCIRS